MCLVIIMFMSEEKGIFLFFVKIKIIILIF